MLELLHDRDVIQHEAREELRRRFREFDIECVDVLIGKPDTAEGDGKIETLLEQLRLRQLSIEQLETYERQQAAAEKLRMLNEAQAQADMQTQLTNARVQVQIAESQGEADLARARKQAEQTVVMAEAELAPGRGGRPSRRSCWPKPTASRRMLAGRGESAADHCRSACRRRRCCCGRSTRYGDPRLYALSQRRPSSCRKSTQPLVPERVFCRAAMAH